jgi:hypothetical protein
MTEIVLLLFAILLSLLVVLYLLHRIVAALERPPVDGLLLEVKDQMPQPRGADPRREPRGPRTPAPVKPQSQQKRRER